MYVYIYEEFEDKSVCEMNVDGLMHATFKYLGEEMMKLGMNGNTIEVLLNTFDPETQNIIFNKLEETRDANTEQVINIIKSLEIDDELRLQVITALNNTTETHGNIDKLIRGNINVNDYTEQINANKNKHWTVEEDSFLKKCVACFNTTKVDWVKISTAMISNGYYRSRSQCKHRWNRGLDPGINREQWSDEEDKHLLFLILKCGVESWSTIAANMKNRSDVQCKKRYDELCKELPTSMILPPSSTTTISQPQDTSSTIPPTFQNLQPVPPPTYISTSDIKVYPQSPTAMPPPFNTQQDQQPAGTTYMMELTKEERQFIQARRLEQQNTASAPQNEPVETDKGSSCNIS